jgi:hypothetical protein
MRYWLKEQGSALVHQLHSAPPNSRTEPDQVEVPWTGREGVEHIVGQAQAGDLGVGQQSVIRYRETVVKDKGRRTWLKLCM